MSLRLRRGAGTRGELTGRSADHGHDHPPVRCRCGHAAAARQTRFLVACAHHGARDRTEPGADLTSDRRRAAWPALPVLLWLGALSGSGVDASTRRHLLADSDRGGNTSWVDSARAWYSAQANTSLPAVGDECAYRIEAQPAFLACMQFAPGCSFLYVPPPPAPSTALENYSGDGGSRTADGKRGLVVVVQEPRAEGLELHHPIRDWAAVGAHLAVSAYPAQPLGWGGCRGVAPRRTQVARRSTGRPWGRRKGFHARWEGGWVHTLSERRGRGRWRSHSNLRGNSLTGALPTEIGMLTSLTGLLLGSQCLNGPLPTELGMMSRLNLLCVRLPEPTLPHTWGKLSDANGCVSCSRAHTTAL